MIKDKLLHSLEISGLIAAYLENRLPEADRLLLEQWMDANTENRKLVEELAAKATQLKQTGITTPPANVTAAYERFREKAGVHRQQHQRRKVYAVAATVAALVAGTLSVFLWKHPQQQMAVKQPQHRQEEILPGTRKAELILGNGSRVALGATADTTFASASNINIRQRQGVLSYGSNGNTTGEAEYNTLRTPVGGEYALTLSDGTRVRLNAASSVYFPAVFTGKQRVVEISGEAWLEVSQRAGQPFIVKVRGEEIQVLGTSFNVKAYPEETAWETTLVTGAVKVGKGDNAILLKPGRMATVSDGHMKESAADLEAVTAWRNGNFVFHHASFGEIFTVLARWYNIKIMYDAGMQPNSNYFTGTVERNIPVGELLKMMEMTGLAKFHVEGNVITVLPYK